MEKDELQKLIKEDNGWAIGVLVTIYNNQESDEQAGEFTIHQNSVGFNSVDAGFITSLASNYLKWGQLSERQMVYVRKNMIKYAEQAIDSDVQKVEVKVIGDKIKAAGTKATPKKERVIQAVDFDLKQLIIRFSYPRGDDRFQNTLTFVKTLENRKFDSSSKNWSCPVSLENIGLLRTFGFNLSKSVLDWEDKNQYVAVKIDHVEGLPDGLVPRPYQIEGVEYIESRHGRALCGDEQGLGKTVEALIWLHRHPETRPAIVACPASLKFNWEKETQKWLPNESVTILSGRWSKTKKTPTEKIVIINYDILSNKYKKVKDEYTGETKSIEQRNTGWSDSLAKLNPQSLICDEIQMVRNLKTNRGKSIARMAKKIPNVLGLSGTPIENRPIEFFNPIKIINPTIFPSYWKYAQEYCGAKHNGFGWDFNGATNTKELHNKLKKTVMIRRLKKDVLPELPPKNRMVITLDIDNRKEYNKASSDIIAYIEDTKGAEAAEKAEKAQGLVTIETLKQLAIKGKINACIEWIERYLEDNNKLVVGCVHTNIVEQLVEHFGEKAVCIYGSTPLKKRHENVIAFQEDPNIKLLIGNVKAAGVGLTLTAANATCTIEFEWKPATHSQFEDRVHRIGQEADSVFAYYLVAQNTIEEDIAALLDEKMKVLNQVLEGEEVDDKSLLTELLKRLKEK